MAAAIPPKPRRRGTWIVVLVGLLEIAALVAFFAVKGVATTVCSVAGSTAPAQAASSGAAGGAAGAALVPPPAAADLGGGAAQSPIPSAAASEAATATAAPDESAQAGAGGNPSDVKVQGDTNQIVDPNCVAKTAAGLLSETPRPPAPRAVR